jgi:hypothetical protein
MKTFGGNVDRLEFAATVSRGKRVLDIGGHKYTAVTHTSIHRIAMNIGGGRIPPFVRAYGKIQDGAKEYRIVDVQHTEATDYVVDFNCRESVVKLRQIMESYNPEVILCMETLEHINYHCEVMNEIARAIKEWGAEAYITLPNNRNWVLDALGWNADHILAFFKGTSWRFVARSELGRCQVTMHACMQKYLWYWWIVYLVSGCQPFSWGFLIKPSDASMSCEAGA